MDFINDLINKITSIQLIAYFFSTIYKMSIFYYKVVQLYKLLCFQNRDRSNIDMTPEQWEH